MTPQRRRKKIRSYKEKKRNPGFPLKKVLFPLAFLAVIFLYLWGTSRIFAGNSKITVAVNGREQVYISTFDRESGSVSNLILPPNTQLNVSRQLGTWKAESVWRLGENEKLEGVLLSETILKNFKIPVNAWAEFPFYATSEGKLTGIFKAFLPYKTNLGMGDRIRLALFSLGVPPAKRINIDLKTQNFLKKTKLIGGEEGFIISENFPQSLYYLFSDTKVNSANLRIEIQNHSGVGRGADLVAAVLEVLGGKAAAITRLSSEDFFCEVSGDDKEIVRKIAQI